MAPGLGLAFGCRGADCWRWPRPEAGTWNVFRTIQGQDKGCRVISARPRSLTGRSFAPSRAGIGSVPRSTVGSCARGSGSVSGGRDAVGPRARSRSGYHRGPLGQLRGARIAMPAAMSETGVSVSDVVTPLPERLSRSPRLRLAAAVNRFPCFDGLRDRGTARGDVPHDRELLADVVPGCDGEESLRLGNFGVCVFFLISGFLLYRPLSRRTSRTAPCHAPCRSGSGASSHLSRVRSGWRAHRVVPGVRLQEVRNPVDFLDRMDSRKNYRWVMSSTASASRTLPRDRGELLPHAAVHVAWAIRSCAGRVATLMHKAARAARWGWRCSTSSPS